MDRELQMTIRRCCAEADVGSLVALGRRLERTSDLPAAASAWDAAFGLDPDNRDLVEARGRVLDKLAVEEHGLCFRYVPKGPFWQGSDDGEPDEAPAHLVWLSAFWIAQTPISWADYARLLGWPEPPAMPTQESETWWEENRHLLIDYRICLQYCEDETTVARDWHAHHPDGSWSGHFPPPPRGDPDKPMSYGRKPVVSSAREGAVAFAEHISNESSTYRLPTEAEWEKAARGGRTGATYPWGDAPATDERCDCDRFGEFSIRPSRAFPPNGYGLYAMSGGVWEWTADRYDALAYRRSDSLPGMEDGDEVEYVIRGGSWADCPAACTVSFRNSANSHQGSGTPVIGFRLVRVEAASP